MKKYPLRITVVYFLVASVWIFVSDWSLAQLSPSTINYLQSVKGFLFVAVSSAVIYFITHIGYNRITRQELDYKRLFDEIPHPILVYDTNTLKVLAANHVFFAKYGYTLQETMELKITALCLPEEEVAVLNFIKRVTNRTSSDNGIWKSRNKSGDIFYTSITSYASTFKSRHVRMFIITDVDEEVKAKQALFSSEKKLKSLIDSSSDAIFIIDKELNITTGNDGYDILYHQVNQHGGKPHFPFAISALPNAAESERWLQHAALALKGESVQAEEQYQLASGERVYYDVVLNPIYVNNEIIGAGCFFRNVTHLKAIELQLGRQLARLREIAWIQSHELRRPLANIMGLVSLLEMDVHKPEQMKENLHLLQQSCNELDVIVKDIVAKSYDVKT